MTAYAELLARLLPSRRFGVVLGLDRMRRILDRLPDHLGRPPDQRLGTVIHVGGTNGKGSTVAMIAALARAGMRAGSRLRVATYTSPHLTSLRERITLDGALVSEDALVAAADRVRAAGGDDLTFFEQLTAIAFEVIACAEVDITILEVGLGGRLDATNVVAAPIAVVTGVALDHEVVLGDTLAAIAAEKAGIFKPGQHVIIGASGELDAVPFLEAAAKAAGAASVTMITPSAIDAVPPIALIGTHQRRNAATALAAIDALEQVAPSEVQLTPSARATALASVQHPGRFEIIDTVILDGAHNPHGARALAETLRERTIRPVLVLAVSADKDVDGIARALIGQVDRVIATRYQQDRAMDPTALAARVASLPGAPPTEHAPDLASALATARLRGGPILIAGSLFLVGEARVMLLGAPADPIWVSDPVARR